MRKRAALMSLLMCTATLEYSQSRNPVRIVELMKQGKVAFGSVSEAEVEKRLAEGLRVLITSGPALDIGRKAAGR